MKPLSFGIIGLNEGNGHPYSWSAICNGYDPITMADCPYPVIPEYLKKQTWPDAQISNAKVTHIWTQSNEISQHVAKASKITHVIDDYRDMIGQVDGILLARDDPESHVELATPFLNAGLPVFVDKMAAPTICETYKLFDTQMYPGQMQCGSAVRHAPEFMLSQEDREAIGPLRQIHAMVIKDWPRYGIHVAEPCLNIVGDQGAITHYSMEKHGDLASLSITWESGLVGSFQAIGQSEGPLMITVVGERGYRILEFDDTFRCFKASIQHFIDGIVEKNAPDMRTFTVRVMEMVMLGETT